MSRGPVEWIEIGFPGTKLSPGIVQTLKRLVDSGTIQIIDLVVLHKNSDGIVTALELEGLEPDEAALFADLDGEVLGLLNQDDIAFAGEALASGSSAAVLVWEDTWVTGFGQAVMDAGGRVVANDRVPDEVVDAAFAAASAESGPA